MTAKPFSKTMVSTKGSVLLLDSLNLAFRWKHKRETDFMLDYMRTVDSLKKSYKCEYVIILADHGSSTFRRSIYPEYKANRKKLQDAQSVEDAEYFQLFFEEYVAILEGYKDVKDVLVLRYKGVEADDLAAFIVKNKKLLGLSEITLVSSDKDWDLLVGKDVIRFSYVTRKETRLDNWEEHHDCTPEEYISIKCLQGDDGDNVPGVEGIGPKKAAELVNKYGSTLDIIANMPIPGKYKYINNLNSFGAEALLTNYKLMDILEFCEEAIGSDNCNDVLTKVKEYVS